MSFELWIPDLPVNGKGLSENIWQVAIYHGLHFTYAKDHPIFFWTVSLGLLVSIRLSDASSFSSSSWLGWLSSFFQGHIRNLPSYLSGEIIFRINKCRWYRNHKEPQANLLLTRTEMAVIHRNASIKEWTGRLVGGKELDENFSFRKKGTCTFSPYRLFLHH